MKKSLTLAILAVLLLQTVSVGWAWQVERPHRDIDIKDRVESAYTNGEASVGLGVAIDDYDEGAAEYGGSDYVAMNMSMTANSRVGISYEYDIGGLWWIPEDFLSRRNTLNLGDDDGTWVDMPYGIFRFYGGRYSAQYQKVWVCSNGFVAFDEEEYTSPTPQDIPYSGAPNAIIAAVWTDLVPDASTKIFTGVYQVPSGTYNYFVIMWKNIKHKLSGQRLTFEIILGNAWDYRHLIQSFIYISYIDVKAINTQFAWGIEDHQGCKGLGDLCDGASLQNFNGKTITFSQNSKSFYLKRLTITFEDTCTQTRFEILETPDRLCGYHIFGGNEEPSPAGAFLKALMGTGALLITAWSGAGVVVAAAGFILDTSLVALDWAEVAELATRQYGNREADVFDYADEGINWAEAYASTWACVDASFSIFVDWILDDANNDQHHSLTITAKAEYWDLTDPDYPVDKPPITTTVNLEIKPDDNNSFDKADPVEEGTYPWLYIDVTHDSVDYYKIWVPQWHEICVMMTIGPSYPDQDFNLYLYDPSRVLRDSSELGAGWTEYVDIIADSEDDWYIKVTPTSGDWGFYSLTVDISDLPKPPPETPSKPSGTTSGCVDITYNYSTSTTDPNGDSIRYEFNWGDGTTNTTGWYLSGATASASHSWSSPGTYNVTVRAQDSNGFWSGWSPPLTVNIKSQPPNAPSVPSGPTTVYRNVWYTYSTSTTDPDGDDVRYEFEFTGPSTNISFGTAYWYASGETGSITVKWETSDPLGTYQIRTRAQDVHELWSDWSPYLTVTLRNPPGWVSPTGHETPTDWSRPSNAYDDDENTEAGIFVPGEWRFGLKWSSFIVLTIPETTSNKLRYTVTASGAMSAIDVDVYKDGAWVDVYQGYFYNAYKLWEEKSFTEGQVTKARVRFGHEGIITSEAAMIWEFDFWGS